MLEPPSPLPPLPFLNPSSLSSLKKDGTLKDFHTSWVPWLQSNAERVVSLVPPSTSPRPTVQCVYGAVGYFPERDRSLTSESPLAHASLTEIRDLVEERVGQVRTSFVNTKNQKNQKYPIKKTNNPSKSHSPPPPSFSPDNRRP